jgi:type II secretory pathway predicted ATPase ExeA
MESSNFHNSKNAFLDTIDSKIYIHIDRVSTLYQTLKDDIDKPFQLILLQGEAGSGKSMLLSKLLFELKDNKAIYLYSTPILDEKEFIQLLSTDILKTKLQNEIGFSNFIKLLDEQSFEETPLVILDEAQLYPDTILEKIRLLSDTKKIKFLLTLTKTGKKTIFDDDHFKNRVWKNIDLKYASKAELKIYIQKKLMKANCFESANMFDDRSIELIYKFTKGNYQETNKLLYTIFELYLTYSKRNKSKIEAEKISTKVIEMAAIHLGFIDA